MSAFSSPTTRKTTPTWSPSLPCTAHPCSIIFQETAVTGRILVQVAPPDDVVVAGREPPPAIDVGRVDHLAVALDVAVAAADREQHEVVAAGVPEPPRRGRLDVHRAPRPEVERLALDLEPGHPRMDEVELVLAVVEVVEPFRAGRQDDGVHAERRDAQLLAQLAEDAGPERVDRRHPVCHPGTLERMLGGDGT